MSSPLLTPAEENRPLLPMSDMRELGLLWLINKVVFHPRGFALVFQETVDGPLWKIAGDGTEAWTMSEELDDRCFAAVEAFLEEMRK